MAKVALQNLSKTFPGDVQAVDNVSLEIDDGEFLVLVGPSGCGKTTTLRMIAGLDEPTGGDVLIGGSRVNDVAPKDRDIAMVFQNYALYPHMTVYKNMAFGLTLRKYPKAEIQERVAAAAKILGLETLLDRKPRALSGGQRQRVAVGRAIVRDPKVFLFDEPLSNLDAALRVQMRGELSHLHKRLGTTMVYVTHDQVEAMTLGDRIAIMKDGKLQQLDTPQNVYRDPANAFVAGFIGSPPMNIVPATLSNENGAMTLQFDSEISLGVDERHRDALGACAGKQILLGIRPESIAENRAQVPVDGASCTVKLAVVEPLGAETLAHFSLGNVSCVARLEGDSNASPDSECVLDFSTANACYFDPDTGARIA